MSAFSSAKWAWLALGCLACLAAGPPAGAQDDEAPPRLADGLSFVVLGRIFRESRYIGRAQNQVNDEFAERENRLRDKIAELELARNSLDQQRTTLTSTQFEQRSDQVQLLELEVQRDSRDLEQDKRLRFDAANRDLEKDVFVTIEEVARENEAYIVFELSSVLFAEKSMDLTEAVIERLDAKLEPEQEPAQ